MCLSTSNKYKRLKQRTRRCCNCRQLNTTKFNEIKLSRSKQLSISIALLHYQLYLCSCCCCLFAVRNQRLRSKQMPAIRNSFQSHFSLYFFMPSLRKVNSHAPTCHLCTFAPLTYIICLSVDLSSGALVAAGRVNY